MSSTDFIRWKSGRTMRTSSSACRLQEVHLPQKELIHGTRIETVTRDLKRTPPHPPGECRIVDEALHRRRERSPDRVAVL